ncbi:MAG: LacI family DNA-binding transcriptional regulator [Clostridia bacterium]|nr:LacI family DNA-binding transcriptional regulator [Clostridia bacterium]
MLIPFLLESDYRNSIWARQTVDGLMREASRKKYTVVQLDADDYQTIDPDELFGSRQRLIIVIGTSISWMPKVLDHFTRKGVKCILISFNPAESATAQGIVRMDHVSAMQMILHYLERCGRPRAALYGFNPNSSADMIKKDCFDAWNAAHGLGQSFRAFDNPASLDACYQAFSHERSRFDAVICANDIVAVSLLRRLRADGIRVPEDLFVTSFGNSALSANVSPSITSVTLEHEELGRQAINLYAFLQKQEAATSVSVRIRSKLIVRDSTACIPFEESDMLALPQTNYETSVNFYSDPEADRLMCAEMLLDSCDDIDQAFLRGLLAGLSTEALEERLFLSASALRYRLKRIMGVAGCKTRTEFQDFLEMCRELRFFEKTDV